MECAASLQLNQYMQDLDLIEQWQAHKDIFVAAKMREMQKVRLSREDIQLMLIEMSAHEDLINDLHDPINEENYMEIGHAILKFINYRNGQDVGADRAQAEEAHEKIYGDNEHSWDRIMRENNEADAIEDASEYFY